VLQSESLAGFYDAGEAAVPTCSNDFTWIKRDWSATVGTSNFLNYRHSEHLDYVGTLKYVTATCLIFESEINNSVGLGYG
jgi:hypothetical protein